MIHVSHTFLFESDKKGTSFSLMGYSPQDYPKFAVLWDVKLGKKLANFSMGRKIEALKEGGLMYEFSLRNAAR